MENTIDTIRKFYDAGVEKEYARIDNRPEFLITARFMARYIKPGQRVLDVGGGPGRYAHHLAKLGCDVTLIDLSPENVKFAKAKAAELGLSIAAVCADAREADKHVDGLFDHVLLMGPLYHLLDEADREQAVRACLQTLKPGGTIWVSFISQISGMIYGMKFDPEIVASEVPMELAYKKCLEEDKTYAGEAFTQAVFIRPAEIEPFMERFPLEKMHLFAQEGILSPCEDNVMGASPAAVEGWLALAERLAEREELLGWAEHIMYVGRKQNDSRMYEKDDPGAEIAREIARFAAYPFAFEGFCTSLPELTDGVISLRLSSASAANPAKGYVPAYFFDICLDGEKIGYIDFRIGYQASLYYGGNIGYGVDEAHRGNGYAGRACLLLKHVMRAHGMKHAYITNNVKNDASRRVCEKIGAKFIRAADVPAGSELYEDGIYRVNIFDMECGE